LLCLIISTSFASHGQPFSLSPNIEKIHPVYPNIERIHPVYPNIERIHPVYPNMEQYVGKKNGIKGSFVALCKII
jgi:hypothetical protein